MATTARLETRHRRTDRRVSSANPAEVPIYLTENLTAAEEQELARLIEEGRRAQDRLESGARLGTAERRRLQEAVRVGQAARDEFIEANMRLVVAVARGYRNWPGASMADMVQEGMIGLMRAVDRFDWRRGFKFSTYATNWIRQHIVRWCYTHSENIRISTNLAPIAHQITKLEDEHAQTGRRLTHAEISELTGLPEDVVRSIRERPRAVAFDVPTQKGEDFDLTEVIEDPATEDPADIVADASAGEALRTALERLGERTGWVVAARMGIIDGRCWTFNEIAEHLGVSTERARQIERLGVLMLRHPVYGLEIREAITERRATS